MKTFLSALLLFLVAFSSNVYAEKNEIYIITIADPILSTLKEKIWLKLDVSI